MTSTKLKVSVIITIVVLFAILMNLGNWLGWDTAPKLLAGEEVFWEFRFAFTLLTVISLTGLALGVTAGTMNYFKPIKYRTTAGMLGLSSLGMALLGTAVSSI